MVSRSSRRALVEPMESRTMFSATVVGTPTIVNVTKLVGPQDNETVTVNPTNPLQAFLLASNAANTLFTATSADGGHTWTPTVRFTGNDGFPPALPDASAAYDSFGNLFIAYKRADTGSTEVLYSYDNAQTFHILAVLNGLQSLPVLATGGGSVWLGLEQSKLTGNPISVGNSGAVAYAAKVTGLGRVAPLKRVASITVVNSSVESLAVGLGGQVAVAYQFATETGPAAVYTRTNTQGLGSQGFGPENQQIFTQVGTVDPIPAQASAGVSAGASLAYDESSDAYTGRLYMAYLDAPTPASANTNIFLRFSDDDGATWSAPIKVNDDISGNSHFLPQLAVDPATGTVAVTWYDARNDNGIPGQGGTNNIANDDVQVYGAVGNPTDTGVSFSPNFVIQPAYSNSGDILVPTTGQPSPDQFGLHNGLAFNNGQLIASWADNSNSTGDNADGPLLQPDVYSAVVTVQTAPAPPATSLVGEFGSGAAPLTYPAPDGTRVTFQLSSGHGYLFIDGSGNLLLRVSDTTARSVLSIGARQGARRISLSNVVINGSIGAIVAPAVDVTGTFTVIGHVNSVALGTVNGGTFAASGGIGAMRVSSLTSAHVLSGANPGPDGVFSGKADTDDSFAAGSINSLIVTGAITGSFIGAGVSPAGGVFGSVGDTIIGGTSSRIGVLRAGSADAASQFEAGAFGVVRLPQTINPANDSRFLI